MTLLQALAVFLGGGATCRYLIGRSVGERYDGDFPLGTYLINASGCFALGLLASLLAGNSAMTALLLALLGAGFLGGYTTFSTCALEGVLLFLDGSRRVALLSLLAAAVGAGVARLVSGA